MAHPNYPDALLAANAILGRNVTWDLCPLTEGHAWGEWVYGQWPHKECARCGLKQQMPDY